MTPEGGGTLSLIVGAVLLRLVATGTYRQYVKPVMGLWLVVAGVVLVVLGLVVVVRTLWSPVSTHEDAHGHGENHGRHGSERIAWLLVAPVLTLLLVAPPALGSFALNRGSARVTTATKSNWTPLTAGPEPVVLTLAEFYQRAFGGGAAVFDGATVQLVGFVASASGNGFVLARYQIACCAADASAAVTRVVGYPGAPPARDRWVTVTGTFDRVADGMPLLIAVRLTPIPTPADPYE